MTGKGSPVTGTGRVIGAGPRAAARRGAAAPAAPRAAHKVRNSRRSKILLLPMPLPSTSEQPNGTGHFRGLATFSANWRTKIRERLRYGDRRSVGQALESRWVDSPAENPCDQVIEGADRAQILVDCPGKGRAVVYSACAPDKESGNEDCAAVIDAGADQLVLAVADGLGGQPGGDQASGLAVKALRKSIQTRPASTSLREAILAGFDQANHAVSALGNGSATTLVVLEVDGHTVRSYHVGDSGVLLFGGLGKVRMETIAHSPVGYAVEAGVLTAHEAIEHEDRHLVSNVVGDPSMHVGMSSPMRLKPRDTVVLASDGLFDNLHAHEIVEHLRKGPLEKGMQALVEECQKRMREPREGHPSKPDDVTVIAFRRSGA